MYISSVDLELVQHLQSYLDRLIRLQENGHMVTKEVNDVLHKINKVYGIGELPSANDLINELRRRFDAKDYFLGRTFNGVITKCTLQFEYENGDVESVDIKIPSTVVIVPEQKP
jgi:hypothetical protein